jgi:hypothetical protein
VKDGAISMPQSIKPHAQMTCVLTREGAFGPLSYFVLAMNKKKIQEKEVTDAVLQARGQGMPLLVLYKGDLAKKIQNMFKDTANVYFKEL